MANKKVSQLTSKPSVLTTDLFPIADPSTGQLFKTTISDLGTAIGSGVSSVNTLVGAVVLDTDDIQELASPTNKWFTDTRARAALSASSPLTYNSGTGAFGIQVATGSQNGYLSSTDWTTFNNKQNALTNPVTGTGATDRLVIWAGTNSVTSSANLFYSVVSGKHAINFGTAFNFISYADNGLGSNLDLVISADDSIKFYTTNFSSLAAKINDGGNFDIYTSLVVSNNITGASIIKSGGTSAQFLKADGSVDSSTYLTTGTAASTYLPLAGGTMTGNLFLPANNTVGGTNYYIGQTMASNDFWRIYGNTVAADQGEMIFELGDNGAPLGSNGQRFRFYYDANVGGTAKSPLTIDYNTISIEAFATITINQNAQTNLIIRNTTAGTSSIASTSLISDTSAGLGEIGKYSSTTTAYKITTPSSTYLYNGTAGNIAIQNDFASGSIVMAAGGSSTAHFTIAPTGATSFSSSISVPNANASLYRILLNTNSGYSLPGTIGYSSNDGNYIWAKAGSASNFTILNDSGSSIFTMLSSGATTLINTITTTGVVFPSTQVASADPNTLDDYEEGTWTPTFGASITTSGSPSGKYTKIGRTVYVTCTFSYTALTGADINISGLPFTNGSIRQATVVAYSGVSRAVNQFFGIVVEASGTNFYIEVASPAVSVSLTAHASCWYQV